MQKKNLKPLILSSLAALAMAGVGAGATFALFTDKAETKINVQAGVVDVTNEATIVSAYSLNETDQNTVDAAGKNAAYVNGGTAKVTDETVGAKTQTKTIDIEKWTPGDGIKLRTAPSNSSNVKTLVRLKIALSGDLAPALEVRVRAAESTGDPIIQGKGNRTIVTSWAAVEAGAEVAAYDVDVAFPNHGTEITSREEGQDNAYQGKSGSIAISYEAIQGNAAVDDLLERVNTKLASEEIADGKANATMFDAFADLGGILSAQQAKEQGFVWNFEDDQFYNASSVIGNKNTYFKVSDSIDESGFSIYASSSFSATNVSLTGIGFDAGEAAGIASISYVGEENTPRTNIIRSNEGATVTINAPSDVVYHYGEAAHVIIEAVANQSYHEFGKTGFLEISKGRVALEKESSVTQIHFNYDATEKKFDAIIVAYEPTVTLPTFSRDEVSLSDIQTGAKLVVELQDNIKIEDAKSDFIWLYQQGLKEQIRVTDSAEVGQEALANAPVSTDNKVAQKTQDVSKQIANSISGGQSYEELKAEDGTVAAENIEQGGLDAGEKAGVIHSVTNQLPQLFTLNEYNARQLMALMGNVPIEAISEQINALPVQLNVKYNQDKQLELLTGEAEAERKYVSFERCFDFAHLDESEMSAEAKEFYEDHAGWECDFTIKFDKAVEAGTIALAGYYESVASYVRSTFGEESNGIVGIELGKDMEAGEELRMIGPVGFAFTYQAIRFQVGRFLCGVASIPQGNVDKNAGTTATVSLKLFNTETKEEITVAATNYTF